jgi:hypothetical protein
MEAVHRVRETVMRRFGDIRQFNAYMDSQFVRRQRDVRMAMQDCGVQTIDAAHIGRKEVADKMIIVDALWFALRTEEPIVCIISRDSDFSPLLSKLKMNGIPSVVITDKGSLRSLRQQATWALSASDVFGLCADHAVGQRNVCEAKRDSQPPSPKLGAKKPPLKRPRSESPEQSVHGQPAEVSEIREDGNRVEEQSDVSEQYTDLLDAIRKVQEETGDVRAQRSAVGLYYSKLNPVVPFSSTLAKALRDNIVKTGGELSTAWVALATDDVKDSDDLDPPTGEYSTEAAGQGSAPWCIVLVWKSTMRCHGTLVNFQPELSHVARRMRLDRSHWSLTVSPFVSREAADRYYQLHFSHHRLLPCFKKLANPSTSQTSS